MTLKWPFKDPDEVLDYSIDWTDRLAGDSIQSSLWIVPDGIDKENEQIVGKETIIWLSGGTLKAKYLFTNRVVTAGGRTMDQTVMLQIRSK